MLRPILFFEEFLFFTSSGTILLPFAYFASLFLAYLLARLIESFLKTSFELLDSRLLLLPFLPVRTAHHDTSTHAGPPFFLSLFIPYSSP